jgi:hypothetical protein
VSNQLPDAEQIVAELSELAARAEAMGAEQRRILDVLFEVASRTTAILERFRSGEGHDGQLPPMQRNDDGKGMRPITFCAHVARASPDRHCRNGPTT